MAGAKFDKRLFTAKFKRDYVAFSAIAIFVLIVLSELVLAVSIPTYFVRSDLWNLQIARQTLLRDFDALRGACRGISNRDAAVAAEVNVLLWDLNLMANYLRKNGKILQREEIRELSSDLEDIRQLVRRLASGKPYNRPLSLKTSGILSGIRRDLTAGGK